MVRMFLSCCGSSGTNMDQPSHSLVIDMGLVCKGLMWIGACRGSDSGLLMTAMPGAVSANARHAAARTPSQNVASSPRAITLFPSRRCSKTESVRKTDADSRRMRSAATTEHSHPVFSQTYASGVGSPAGSARSRFAELSGTDESMMVW